MKVSRATPATSAAKHAVGEHCNDVARKVAIPRRPLPMVALLLLAGSASWAAPAIALDAAQDAATTQSQALPSDADLEAMGAVIGRIDIQTGDVFDLEISGESGPVYALANRMHRRTRDHVVRDLLLFASGDRYSRRLLDESARLLRAEGYLADADIEPVRFHDGVVDISVSTRDAWTLQPGVSFGRKGGENSFGLELQELNLLGLGVEFNLKYKSTVDREERSIGWVDRHFLGSRYRAEAGYANNSDGGGWNLAFERPFYALDTRWAAGAQLARVDRVESLYQLGEVFDRYRQQSRRGELYWGRSQGLKAGWVRRWTLGVAQDQQRFSIAPEGSGSGFLPASRDLVSGWLGFELLEDDFAIWRDRDQIGRSEDIQVGTRLSARLGRVSETLGADRNGWIYRAEASRALALPADSTLRLQAELGGRHEDGRDVDQLLGLSSRYYYPISDRSLLFARLDGSWGQNLELDHRLLLGGDNGLRGYPLRYQAGDRRALFTLEQRYFTDWYPFRLFRVGAAAFFDAGRTWGDDGLGSPQLGVLTSAGLGLRLASTRASLGNIVHIDLAFPLNGPDDISGAQLVVEVRRGF